MEDGFAAYAKMRVRGAMIDMIRRNLPISRGGAARRRLIVDKERDLSGQLGRSPTSAELADALGMTQADLFELRTSSEPLRFESIEQVYSDQDSMFADTGPDGFEILAEEQLRDRLISAIDALPDRLKLIVSGLHREVYHNEPGDELHDRTLPPGVLPHLRPAKLAGLPLKV